MGLVREISESFLEEVVNILRSEDLNEKSGRAFMLKCSVSSGREDSSFENLSMTTIAF